MDETETNIQQSLLNTLSFLGSEAQQREFAGKVSYKSYAGEFACWWFDTFYPDEPEALVMFKPAQLHALRAFSEVFDRNLRALLLDESQSIEELQAKPEWQVITASARTATFALGLAEPHRLL